MVDAQNFRLPHYSSQDIIIISTLPFFDLKKLYKNSQKNKIKFQANLHVNQILYTGVGSTKKNAEINAAKKALERI